MKKERIFYLDFVRAIAVCSILVTHYNALFLGVPEDKMIGDDYIFNVPLGMWGVSLFFIISGAALMHVYGERLELGKYYKKRFLGIYPMFWIAYIGAFLFYFVLYRGYDTSMPKIRIFTNRVIAEVSGMIRVKENNT